MKFELLGYRWTVKPEFLSIIRERVIPSVLSGKDSSDLKVVKKKLVRNSFIFSTDDDSPGIFVKVHKYGKAKERIKAMVLASRAKAEWRKGEEMFRLGLPVAEPLGFGEKRSRGIVTGCVSFHRVIPGCVGLADYLARSLPQEPFLASSGDEVSSSHVDELLESLGGLVRRLHSAGFWHPDMHTGNVLVDSHVTPPKLWLVDLHSVGRASDISHRRRRRDLAKLIFSLRDFLEESQLRTLLAAYEPGADENETEELLAKILKASDSLHKRRVRSRSKRCLKTSGSFVVEKRGDKKLYRRREFDADTILNAVNRHKEACFLKGPEFIKATPKRSVTSFLLTEENGTRVYVKEFSNSGFIKFLETVFYTHRGKRAWKAANRLRVLGIPCAEPVALVEQRSSGLLRTSYLLMENVSGADQLDDVLRRAYLPASGRLSREKVLEKRNLVRAGAHFLRSFHSMGIYHEDLSSKNVLVTLGDAGEPRFYCVDSDSIQFPLRLSLRRRIKNLAQLNGLPGCITSADKVRFYKEYFGLTTLTPRHRIFIRIIRWISRRRVELARLADLKLAEKGECRKESYEDIASI